MAKIYVDRDFPVTQQNRNHVYTNDTTVAEWVNGTESSLFVTPLRQDQCDNTLFDVWVAGTASSLGTIFVNSAGVITLVSAGNLVLHTATGQAIADSDASQTGSTDNKINVGWYTNSSDSKKYLCFLNRLNSTTITANTLFVKAC